MISKFKLLVFRHPVDVIHHLRRVFKNIVIDTLKKVPDLFVLLFDNGGKGVIDMPVTIGRSRNKPAIDIEMLKCFL